MISNNFKKIILRSVEKSDLKLIHKWRNKENIQPFVREYRELTLDHVSGWYDSIINSPKFEFFIIEDLGGRPIGISGLTYIDWINKHADLHLGLYDEDWGCDEWGSPCIEVMLDYGFNHLNLNKIYAEIYEIDKNKINLFSNHKFKFDASLREHYFYKGNYITSHILSLLRSEYEKD